MTCALVRVQYVPCLPPLVLRRCTVFAAVVDLAGGHMQEQIAKLKETPDIIVATPGRLVQHLEEGVLPGYRRVARPFANG